MGVGETSSWRTFCRSGEARLEQRKWEMRPHLRCRPRTKRASGPQPAPGPVCSAPAGAKQGHPASGAECPRRRHAARLCDMMQRPRRNSAPQPPPRRSRRAASAWNGGVGPSLRQRPQTGPRRGRARHPPPPGPLWPAWRSWRRSGPRRESEGAAPAPQFPLRRQAADSAGDGPPAARADSGVLMRLKRVRIWLC